MLLFGMNLLKDTDKLYVSYGILLSRYQPENVNTIPPVVAALKVSTASHLCDAVYTQISARHNRLAVSVNLPAFNYVPVWCELNCGLAQNEEP